MQGLQWQGCSSDRYSSVALFRWSFFRPEHSTSFTSSYRGRSWGTRKTNVDVLSWSDRPVYISLPMSFHPACWKCDFLYIWTYNHLMVYDFRKIFDWRRPVVVYFTVNLRIFQVQDGQRTDEGRISSKDLHLDGHFIHTVTWKESESEMTFNDEGKS